MKKTFVRAAAVTAVGALTMVSLTACGPKAQKTTSGSKPTAVADPGKKLENLSSATLGEPSQIKPNAGAMALCDDNRIKTKNVNFSGVKGGFSAMKGAKGEDCVVRVFFDARTTGSKGMTFVLATPRSLHVSGLFSQSTFSTGPKQFSDFVVPDDSTLTLLFQNPKRPAGMQAVTNKNEEPNSRAFQAANVPVFRQLVGMAK